MKYWLTLFEIGHPLFYKFSVQRLHIGKNSKFTYSGCISDIKTLIF